jgi:diguanylate cyclase (GGDEF)-like protein/PAS domain S-box-containing protein
MTPGKAPSGPRARRLPSNPSGSRKAANPGGPAPAADTSEEVFALIEVLHSTGKRLEELTAGEVDTVADRHGRPLLLQHAQEELRHTEAARQAAILNALPAHIALLDSQGRILSVNETWRRFADANGFRNPGYGIGLNYLEVCDHARGKCAVGAREVAEGIRAVLGGGAGTFALEYQCHSPEQQRWFLLTVTPLIPGETKGAVVVHVEITAKRQADESLRESEGRFRQIAESIRDVFFLEEADGSRLLYVSPTYARIWGRSCESLYAKPDSWVDAVHREDQAAVRRQLRGSMEANGQAMEYRIVRPGGEVRWIEARSFPVRDDSGTVVRIAGLAKDITELKRTTLELRESERRFSEMLGNVELVALMLDREARITYCNEYLLRLTGWRREELVGRSCLEVLVPPDQGGVKELFATLFADEAAAGHHENEILTRAGARRLIRWNYSVLRSGSGDVAGIAAIGEDISEQKAAEVRIRRLTHVYATLSGINTLIVRARGRDELFQEACRIAVEVGAFRMAWIGVVDPKTLDGRVVASFGGEEELLDLVRLMGSEGTPDSERPGCRALRQAQAVICNDIATDASLAPVRSELLGRGLRSAAYFPLTVTGRPEAVMALVAGEEGVFDDEEIRLLTELAGDLSFAMDHIAKQERLDYLAYYDVLTGLANRTLFLERVAQYMRSAAGGGHQLALFLIDPERFRNINDNLGRAAGDALLKQVAEVLTRISGDAGLLARVGGDQFAAVLPVVKGEGHVARLLEKAVSGFLEHPFRLNDAVFRISARAGVALYPEDGADADTLFRRAEAALEKAKKDGERYTFYTQGMTEAVAGKLNLESQLREALEKGEFVLHYQPKVNLASGRLTGTEALIRWSDPRTGLVPPGRFIPILEETGLIHEVGRWALNQAGEDYRRWRAGGLHAVRIAVNVSPLQLRSRGFIDEIRQVVGRGPDGAAGLELEITESLIMEDVKHSIASLQAIRALGVRIAIDDFGTGFSSLSYLSRLPVDTLKIDRAFVTDMTAGPEGLALVSTIISMAHSLKLDVVAEGVETEEQSRLLRLLGCDEMQGFLFSKPVPVELFESRFLVAPPA